MSIEEKIREIVKSKFEIYFPHECLYEDYDKRYIIDFLDKATEQLKALFDDKMSQKDTIICDKDKRIAELKEKLYRQNKAFAISDNAKIEAENTELKKRVEGYETAYSELNTEEIERLRTELEQSQKKVEELEKTIQIFDNTLDKTATENEQIKKRVEELEKENKLVMYPNTRAAGKSFVGVMKFIQDCKDNKKVMFALSNGEYIKSPVIVKEELEQKEQELEQIKDRASNAGYKISALFCTTGLCDKKKDDIDKFYLGVLEIIQSIIGERSK